MLRKIHAAVWIVLVLTACSRSAAEHVALGNQLVAKGEHSEAILNYRKAIQQNPSFGEAHYRLGLALLHEGNSVQGVEELAIGVRQAPELTEAKLEFAKVALAIYTNDPRHPKRFYDEVRKISEDLLARDPASAQGLRLRGELALLDNQMPAALDAFQRATKRADALPEAFHGVVRVLAKSGRNGEAEREALNLIAISKTYGPIYDDLYKLYIDTGRPKEAEELFRQKVANNPESSVYRLQLAAHFSSTGNELEMDQTLTVLVQQPARFPDGAIEAAQFYFRLAKWEKAQKLLDTVVRSTPSQKQRGYALLAQVAITNQGATEAEKTVNEWVTNYPDDPEARLSRASLWLDTQDPAKLKAAVLELEQVKEKLKSSEKLWYALGKAYTRIGDIKKADAAYRQSITINPEYRLAYIALIELNLENGQAKTALQLMDRFAHGPGDPEIKTLHARALRENGRFNEAHTELAPLARAYPEMRAVQLEFARTLASLQRLDQAELVIRKFYRPGQNDVKVLEHLARIQLQRGRAKQAFDLVTAELHQNPQSKPLRVLLAQVAVADRKPAVAAEQLAILVKAEPNSAFFHFQLGEALRLQGDMTNARTSLEKAEQLDPNNPIPTSVLAYLLQESGQNDDAERRWRHVLKLRPDDSNALNNLAYVLAESGRNLDEALTLAQSAVRKVPASSNYVDTLGWVYLKKKKYQEAIQTFRAASRMDPSSTVCLLHLGIALIEIGNNQEARIVLGNALKKNPTNKEASQIREALRKTG